MSAERLQQSLRRLHETADALDAGSPALAPVLVEAPPAVVVRSVQTAPRPRSLARVVTLTLAHSAASVAALALVCVAGDPLVPRPDGPSLAAAVEVDAPVVTDAEAIPQKGLKRP